MPARRLLCVALLLLAAVSPALGQITWTYNYTDTAGQGFNDTTDGALRRASVAAATTYLTSVIDGRGNIETSWARYTGGVPGVLAGFGAGGTTGVEGWGYYHGRPLYERGRSNASVVSGSAGSGEVNFTGSGGVNWHYDVAGTNTTLTGSRYDLVSVLIHEVAHGLGFASGVSNHTTGRGTGRGSITPGTNPDWFNTWDRWLQRGNGDYASNAIFHTDVTSADFGKVIPSRINAFLGGNNSNGGVFTNNESTGLYFGGTFAREVFGGAVPVYSPTSFQGGSSMSHVNVGPTAGGTGYGEGAIGLMNYNIGTNTIRRFQPYEIAMLMDMGWNVYNWNSGGGDWTDGQSDLTLSKWTSNSGITVNAALTATYNTFNAQGEAPILPVYAKDAANIVLNFRNTTTSAYTSTNNLPHEARVSRVTFTSTNSTGGITVAGGTLNFGIGADGLPTVLKPKIEQNGSGAVTISSAIRTNNIADTDLVVSGRVVATYQGHTGITVEGTGSGQVTLSGNITGTGGITKNSSTFNLILSGTNSYTGTTTVNAGAVYVNGTLSNTANGVTVNGGTLGGTNGTISRAVTVNSGGTIEGGTTSTIGELNVQNNVTVNSGGNLRAELGAGTSSDRLDLTGGTNTLDLKNGSLIQLSANGFTRSGTTYTLADLDSATATLLKVNGSDVNPNTTITTFTSTGGNGGTNSNGVGDVDFVLSGFSLTSGDRFVLQRNSVGDLVLSFTPVPEPAGVLLLCGLAGAAAVGWRRWRANRAA